MHWFQPEDILSGFFWLFEINGCKYIHKSTDESFCLISCSLLSSGHNTLPLSSLIELFLLPKVYYLLLVNILRGELLVFN